MTWLDFAENPKAIGSLYESVPSLEGVEVMSISFDRGGPTLGLAIALNEYPASPPSRWQDDGGNAVVLNLQLLGVESIEFRGWSTTNLATIEVHREDNGLLRFRAHGSALSLLCHCGWLRVAGISSYHRETGENVSA